MDFGIFWVSQNSTVKFMRNYDEERMKEKGILRMFGLLMWIFNFIISLIQCIIGLITSVIESIPMAE